MYTNNQIHNEDDVHKLTLEKNKKNLNILEYINHVK